MREELAVIKGAIDNAALPSDPEVFLKYLWDEENGRFHVQETYVLDYKETVPTKFSDDYGVSILRLCIAFYNSFGGIILFGVKDRVLTVSGIDAGIDIESLNRVLTECSGFSGECLSKIYEDSFDGENKRIEALLIPRRSMAPPLRLNRALGKYPSQTLWVRDRAEVPEAKPKHFPLLYSNRHSLPSESTGSDATPVHRSLPPSPATLKTFVGRESLLVSLWDWLVFGDHPRLYLHGPGGSGKSTLAFEFAKTLTEAGQQISFNSGEHLDYVIFISGKETELNPHSAKEQIFKMQQFKTAQEQFAQISYHSGLLAVERLAEATDDMLAAMLDDLFANFNGLIVIDDIDAMHRKRVESGEETLLMKAFLAKGRTRILYTLRFPPANANRSAIAVPGLNSDEFYKFVEACCTQFEVSPPDGQYLPKILESTKALPLLIETVVGLRQFCGNYGNTLATFTSKGGDDARRYLYQREYDRLEREGKSRQVLAGLVLFEDPIGFSTLSKLFQFTPEQVRDALIECNSVFLSTIDDLEIGETLYQLTPPSVPFIKRVSEELSYINNLRKSVDHFKDIRPFVSADEAALIVKLDRLIRQKRYHEILALGESLPKDDPILINPKIRAFLGQAYSELGPGYRETARELFRAAEGLKYRDVFMLRSWYHLELTSGHGLGEASRVCDLMLNEANLTNRVRSEFLSKQANCLYLQGVSLVNVSREKALSLFQRSIERYLEALLVGEKSGDIDLDQTLSWLEKPVQKFMGLAHEDPEHVFTLLESLAEKKRDVHERGIKLYLEYLLRSPIPVRNTNVRNRVRGFCIRAIKKIGQSFKSLGPYPGFQLVTGTLEDIRAKIDVMEKAAG